MTASGSVRSRAAPTQSPKVAFSTVPRITRLAHLLRIAARGLLARTGMLALLAGGACHEVSHPTAWAALARPRKPWPLVPPEVENDGMLSIGSIVLTVEDITRAGDFWRAALGYVEPAAAVG